MTRVRTDNVFGTTTDNPLTAGATTMNSAGLANLAAVSSAEAIIILDPNRVSGAPEIVVVTAHTGSATSATIARGQFGTSAREHAAGTEWVHGPIASNATSYVTAADDQGDFVPMNAWESFTPTLSNFTVGSATRAGAFVRIGRLVHFWAQITLSGSTMGTSPALTLPVAINSSVSSIATIARCAYGDTGTATYAGHMRASGLLIVTNVGATYPTESGLTSTVPHTWANTDIITIVGSYEAAS